MSKYFRYTFALIKPNAIRKVFYILSRIRKEGFQIVALKMLPNTNETTLKLFYKEHEEKEFFNSLLEFMQSGKLIAVILKKDRAIEALRRLIGVTDPKKAHVGSIRKLYGETITRNAIHGSSSKSAALREMSIMLPEKYLELKRSGEFQ